MFYLRRSNQFVKVKKNGCKFTVTNVTKISEATAANDLNELSEYLLGTDLNAIYIDEIVKERMITYNGKLLRTPVREKISYDKSINTEMKCKEKLIDYHMNFNKDDFEWLMDYIKNHCREESIKIFNLLKCNYDKFLIIPCRKIYDICCNRDAEFMQPKDDLFTVGLKIETETFFGNISFEIRNHITIDEFHEEIDNYTKYLFPHEDKHITTVESINRLLDTYDIIPIYLYLPNFFDLRNVYVPYGLLKFDLYLQDLIITKLEYKPKNPNALYQVVRKGYQDYRLFKYRGEK